MNPRALWCQVTERIDDLSLRERGLAFVVVMAVIYFAAQGLVFHPLQVRRRHLMQVLRTERNRVQALDLQTQTVLNESGQTAASRAELADLKTQLATVDRGLQSMTQGLVSPRDMMTLTQQVLTHSPGVHLVSLQNLPADVVVPGQTVSAALYRHGLRIVVTGHYPALVTYLQSLEGLHWKVFWGQADLQVTHYPVSQLTIVLYTLSLRRGWIGA